MNDGVHVSTDNGNSWNIFQNNTGLTDTDIQSLSVNKINGLIYAITKSSIFWIRYNGSFWKAISKETSHTDITSVVASSVVPSSTNATGTIITNNQPNNQQVLGTGTKFNQELKKGDIIIAAGQAKAVANIESDTILTVDEHFNPNLAANTVFTINTILTGGAFSGFVEDKIKEWPNFYIQPPINSENHSENQKLDLNSLYPKILADSWIVLQKEDNSLFKPLLVRNISTISRRDFALDSKITQVETAAIINPNINTNEFGLRDTIILAESTELNLAEEPLTVISKQHEIFLDPIVNSQTNNKIFLKEFVTGLKAQQNIIVSGKLIRAKIKNIAGVYSFNKDDEKWERKNNGLTNTVVRSLNNHEQYLFAATEDGVFQSTDKGENWKLLNPESLKNKDIQALVVSSNGDIFAGNKGDGIFRSNIFEKNWELFNNGLTNKNITALLVGQNNQLFAGTTNGGIYIFTDNIWSLSNTGLSSADIICMTINKNNNNLFAGTSGGLFVSDDGSNWQKLSLDIIDDIIVTIQSMLIIAIKFCGNMLIKEFIILIITVKIGSS
ncbi:MAG: hypothetical protein HC908_01685 [Calothrix sp. SM1_7_51]|nr:hypothetical protein [Calothrix sp. SM1_7_51]